MGDTQVARITAQEPYRASSYPYLHMHSLRSVVSEQSWVGIGPVKPIKTNISIIQNSNYEQEHDWHSINRLLKINKSGIITDFTIIIIIIIFIISKKRMYVPVIVASSTMRSCVSCCRSTGRCPTILLLLMTMECTCDSKTPTYETPWRNNCA